MVPEAKRFTKWTYSRRRGEQEELLPMHPKWLARFASERLLMILDMDRHTIEYGTIVHERVGRFGISANGQLIRPIEVRTGSRF